MLKSMYGQKNTSLWEIKQKLEQENRVAAKAAIDDIYSRSCF
jgi:hypothetical protein